MSRNPKYNNERPYIQQQSYRGYPGDESSDEEPYNLLQTNSRDHVNPRSSNMKRNSYAPLLSPEYRSSELPPLPPTMDTESTQEFQFHQYQQYNQVKPPHYQNGSQNQSSHPSLKKEDSAVEYEMTTIDRDQDRDRDRDLPALPDTQLANNYRNPFNDTFDNIPLPQTNYFNSQMDQAPNQNGDSSEYDMDKRSKRNERNRIRSLRSKPRFHYTRLPYFTIIITLIQVIVFMVELAKMASLTGSAFQTSPYFNPMLGPSTYLLIYMGARYVPCMHQIVGITDDTTITFPCANSTSIDTYTCSLSDLCGLSGIPTFDNGTKFAPNQWYRIFIPIFLHAGFLHILFNLLLQLTMGASIERNIGILKYAIIYIASGIAGFLLGANFTPQGIASTGASGSLFGVVATNIILFIYAGKKNSNMYGTKHYKLFIFFMFCEIVVSFVLGLLPGLDNFSHLGGFAMGILTAVLLLKDPFWIFQDGIITYRKNPTTWEQFVNNWNPLYAYEDKIPQRFVIWSAVRVVALVLIIIYFVLLSKNFFNNKENSAESCTWCKYFNCIPVKGWCDIGEVTVTTEPSGPTATATPSQTTTPAPMYTTSIYTTTVPTTAVAPQGNTEGTNGGFKRQVEVFENTFAEKNTTARKLGLGIAEQPAVGLGLYFIVTFLMLSFLKKKKIL
ncbi:uncharacterized protein LODBEIA_P13400 [Lodderomyces beijingensis]|uniref:Rhomboid-type serine protease n=1 Tax=Lodderomyces beijingensis TaxID=1775926 RepID=A0ABP0ZJ04_9ASCO